MYISQFTTDHWRPRFEFWAESGLTIEQSAHHFSVTREVMGERLKKAMRNIRILTQYRSFPISDKELEQTITAAKKAGIEF